MADIAIDGSSELRIFEQQLDYALDFFTEVQAEPRHLGFVPSSGLYDFKLGFRMELVVHPAKRERRRSNTT